MGEGMRRTVLLEDAGLRQFDGGFTSIPNFILTDTELSLGARLTYAMLLKYAWQTDFCFPAQERLAADLGVDDRSIRRYLRELKRAGVVTWKQLGLNQPNIYTVVKNLQRNHGPDKLSGLDRTPVSYKEDSLAGSLKIQQEEEKRESSSIQEGEVGEKNDPPVTPEELMEDWNESSRAWHTRFVRPPLSKSRRDKVLLRLKEHPEVEFWCTVWEKIGKSPFLLGNGRPPRWFNFHWLFKNDHNVLKVYEGDYEPDRDSGRERRR